MSRQAILQMKSDATQDEVLRQKLQAAVSPDSLIGVAAENGYEFTIEDLVAIIQEQVAAQKAQQSAFNELTEELSDEDAEMVAGGAAAKIKRASVNSYFHQTGVVFESGECFIGSNQIARNFYVWMVNTFERAQYNSSLGEYEVYDEDGDSGNIGATRVSQLGLDNWQSLLNLTES